MPENTPPICPLCGRPILKKKDGDRHHLQPRSRGGKNGEIVTLHRICHRKIHSAFTEKELERKFNTIEALLKTMEIKKFVKWVEKKPSDFYDSSRDTRGRFVKRGGWKRG